ncbi:MAG: hypothetical protein J2P25_07340 [Nocardiopsaceae bacterium]|nr:hypothetical protein [Nocardiopsaceae bacterium]
MRSGWPHTQEGTGTLASQRQAYGPAESWPDGYPALGSNETHGNGGPGNTGHGNMGHGNGGRDYGYPAHGMDPYAAGLHAVEPPVVEPRAVEPPGSIAPAGPAGTHPYAPAPLGGEPPAGGYTASSIESFGYGDPGYSNARYDGPSSQDTGIASTQTVRGVVESSAPYGGGYAPDIYHQPWDYSQPLRYEDEGSVYPGRSLGSGKHSRGPAGGTPSAYSPGDYNGSELSRPGVAGAGYDLSGIIGTGEFPDIDYDQPGYDRLSYDDPRYADSPGYDDRRYSGSQGGDDRRGSTRFDMPAVDDEPRRSGTRTDMRALGERPGSSSPRHGSTRFDMPAVDDVSASRLDHVWPAREDLPDDPGFSGRPKLTQTRFDMPAVEDYQYGDQFDQTSADGMRSLAPETEFRAVSAGLLSAPVGADLVAPAEEQPVSWADEPSFEPSFDPSFEQYGDLAELDDGLPERFGDLAELDDDLTELDSADAQDAPAAFTRDPQDAPTRTGTRTAIRTGSRRAVGKRRGRSNDRRQWMALGAIAVVASGAIGGVLMKFVFSGPSGPAHVISTPSEVAGYTEKPSLEQQMKVGNLRDGIIHSTGGQASNVKSGVYQQGSSGIGSSPQTYMFVGGNLANSDPSTSVADFENTYKQGKAHTVPTGKMGGEAACAIATVNGSSVSMCVWFDNDTFGDMVSPTMTPAKLAATMEAARPHLEHVAK